MRTLGHETIDLASSIIASTSSAWPAYDHGVERMAPESELCAAVPFVELNHTLSFRPTGLCPTETTSVP